MNYLRQLYTRDTKPFWFKVRVNATILFVLCLVGVVVSATALDRALCGVFALIFGCLVIR